MSQRRSIAQLQAQAHDPSLLKGDQRIKAQSGDTQLVIHLIPQLQSYLNPQDMASMEAILHRAFGTSGLKL